MARYAAKVAAGLVPAAVVAGFGMPALGALVLIAVLAAGVVCWVIGSQDRTNRASQILRACRGTPSPQPVPAAPPAGTGILKRTLKLAYGREKHRC